MMLVTITDEEVESAMRQIGEAVVHKRAAELRLYEAQIAERNAVMERETAELVLDGARQRLADALGR